jgi:hypothetical protein
MSSMRASSDSHRASLRLVPCSSGARAARVRVDLLGVMDRDELDLGCALMMFGISM